MSDLELLRAVTRNAFAGDVGKLVGAALELLEEAVTKQEELGNKSIRHLTASYLLHKTADIEFKTRLGKQR